jgi:tRNA(Ile2) C34 agmatinyltransferase TiaS
MRIKALFIIPLACGLLLCSGPLFAHHGASAYDNSTMTKLTGTVTDFQFIQPHPLIFLDVKDANGNVQKWFVEMTAPNHLVHFGWNGHKLHPGDQITVTGHAAKNGNKTLNLSKIYNADGQEIPLGAAPAPPADSKAPSSY